MRRDRTVYYQTAPEGSEEWVTLERRPASVEDVNELLIGLRSEDLAASSAVVLTEFSVRAKRLAYIPRFSDGDFAAPFTWNFQGPMPKSLQKWAPEAPNKSRVSFMAAANQGRIAWTTQQPP